MGEVEGEAGTQAPAAGKVPDEVLASLDWASLITRLTTFAHARLRGGSIEDAKQLAKEAMRVLLDPESTVRWDYVREPDPLRCLGSIVNGLLRNHFRHSRTKAAKVTGTLDEAMALQGGNLGVSPEARVSACELRRKVLGRVYELSDGDELVQQMAVLADDGVIEVDEQMQELNVPKPRLYEARRRFAERLATARCELEEGP